jgi:hypothetical protein
MFYFTLIHHVLTIFPDDSEPLVFPHSDPLFKSLCQSIAQGDWGFVKKTIEKRTSTIQEDKTNIELINSEVVYRGLRVEEIVKKFLLKSEAISTEEGDDGTIIKLQKILDTMLNLIDPLCEYASGSETSETAPDKADEFYTELETVPQGSEDVVDPVLDVLKDTNPTYFETKK